MQGMDSRVPLTGLTLYCQRSGRAEER